MVENPVFEFKIFVIMLYLNAMTFPGYSANSRGLRPVSRPGKARREAVIEP
jgi:hypothetical protein